MKKKWFCGAESSVRVGVLAVVVSLSVFSAQGVEFDVVKDDTGAAIVLTPDPGDPPGYRYELQASSTLGEGASSSGEDWTTVLDFIGLGQPVEIHIVDIASGGGGGGGGGGTGTPTHFFNVSPFAPPNNANTLISFNDAQGEPQQVLINQDWHALTTRTPNALPGLYTIEVGSPTQYSLFLAVTSRPWQEDYASLSSGAGGFVDNLTSAKGAVETDLDNTPPPTNPPQGGNSTSTGNANFTASKSFRTTTPTGMV